MEVRPVVTVGRSRVNNRNTNELNVLPGVCEMKAGKDTEGL